MKQSFDLGEKLNAYQTTFQVEKKHLIRFKDLLKKQNPHARNTFPGHLTASAWVVNTKCDAVLLLLHTKLGRWLQPGGHADGELDLQKVSKKELVEETSVSSVVLLKGEIFDIDVHKIPANEKEPEHFHYDVRFLYQSTKNDVQNNHESKMVKWVPISEVSDYVNDEQSIMRMVDKTLLMLKSNGQNL
ncbi:MAG TPA: NUDIX hydrolase [Cyclobacteriaceae bacterium]